MQEPNKIQLEMNFFKKGGKSSREKNRCGKFGPNGSKILERGAHGIGNWKEGREQREKKGHVSCVKANGQVANRYL